MDTEAKTPAPEWLLSRDGKRFGPMTSGQLRSLCKAGKIQPADLICRAGADRWTPAGEVQGLFPASPQMLAEPQQPPIRPVEEATATSSSDADSYWKSVGAVFCIANLAACGAFGLVKSPPVAVQTMQSIDSTMKKVNADIDRLGEAVSRSAQSVHDSVDRVNKDLGTSYGDPSKALGGVMKKGKTESLKKP